MLCSCTIVFLYIIKIVILNRMYYYKYRIYLCSNMSLTKGTYSCFSLMKCYRILSFLLIMQMTCILITFSAKKLRVWVSENSMEVTFVYSLVCFTHLFSSLLHIQYFIGSTCWATAHLQWAYFQGNISLLMVVPLMLD